MNLRPFVASTVAGLATPLGSPISRTPGQCIWLAPPCQGEG